MSQPKSPAVWIAATRPQFLTITVVAVLTGLAAAWHDGVLFNAGAAALTLLAALLVHAGANLVNDYHDRDADVGNDERVSPFTGGSRVIQDGVLTASVVAAYGYALLAATVVLGVLLALDGRPQLWTVGVIGLALAVVYSAPPLRLSARGIGEFVIAAAWLLVVVGADLVQRSVWSPTAVAAGGSVALLVAAILHANEFPDRKADAAAEKRTIVVRLGVTGAAWAYLVLVLAAYVWLIGAVAGGWLPWLAAAGLLSAPLSLFAARELLNRAATRPSSELAPALKATIGAAHLNGLLIAAALIVSAQ